ncbi:hypothetical protein HDV01_005541 [Terramyces sp. JEL0728]|nr:hypothetical protein HDV01_005541 [Terramyces sp. JEL0728]
MSNDCDILFGQYSFYKKSSKRQVWGFNPSPGTALASATQPISNIPPVTILQQTEASTVPVAAAPIPTVTVKQPMWCCTSPGITCSNDQTAIIALDLSNQGYYGTITADMFKFAHLQTLNMSFNFLNGDFPQIPADSTLKQIDFQSNRFSAFDGFLSNNLVEFNFRDNPGIQFKTLISSVTEQNACCIKVQDTWTCSNDCVNTNSPVATTTPVGSNNDSSSAPIAAILGWVLGLLILVAIVGFLAYRHFTHKKSSKSPILGTQEHQQQNIVEIAALVRSITDSKRMSSTIKSDPSEEGPFLADKIEVLSKDPIDIKNKQIEDVAKESVDLPSKEFSIRSNEILDVKPLKNIVKVHVHDSTDTGSSSTSIYDETSDPDDLESLEPEILAPNDEISRDVLYSIIEITTDKMNNVQKDDVKIYYATTQEEDANVLEDVVREYYSFERKKTILNVGDRKDLKIGLGEKENTFMESPAWSNRYFPDKDSLSLTGLGNKTNMNAAADGAETSTTVSDSSTFVNTSLKDPISLKLKALCTEIRKSDDYFPEREKTFVNKSRSLVIETVTEKSPEAVASSTEEARLFAVDKKYSSLPRLQSKKNSKSELVRRKTAITARELERKENAAKRSKSFNIGSADPLKMAKKRNQEVKNYFEANIFSKIGVPITAIYPHPAEPATHEITVNKGDRIQINRHGHNGCMDSEAQPLLPANARKKPSPYLVCIPVFLNLLVLSMTVGVIGQWLLLYICSRFDDPAILSTQYLPGFFANEISAVPDWETCSHNPNAQVIAGRWTMAMGICGGIPALITVPMYGILSDKFGRKPLIILSMSTAIISLGGIVAISYFGVGLWLILATAIVTGLMGSFTVLINNTLAYFADTTEASERSNTFVVGESVFFAGFAFGPLIGGILARNLPNGPSDVFVISWILTTIITILTAIFLPESKDMATNRAQTDDSSSLKKNVQKIVRVFSNAMSTSFCFILLAICCLTIVQEGQSKFFNYVSYTFGWDAQDEGQYVLAASFCRMLSMLLVYPLLTRLFANFIKEPRGMAFFELTIIRTSLMLFALATLVIAFADKGWILYSVIPIQGFAIIAIPTLRSLLSNAIPAESQAQLFSGISTIEKVLNLIFSVVYQSIWAATVENNANTFLLMDVGVLLVAFLLMLVPTVNGIVKGKIATEDQVPVAGDNL